MIAQVYQTLGNVLVLLLLLACSAFFSGSETAFFNLTQRQIRLFEASPVRLQKLAAHLLRQPGHLLNCLLFGNMMVNVLFYAVSSVLVLRIGHAWGFGAATISAFATFLVLVLFGEILPKSLTYASSRSLAVATALPLFLVVQPRVDMVTCDVTESPQAVRELMQKHHLTKIPVYAGNRDNIIGIVQLRQLFLRPGVPLDRLVQPAQFVPEQKTVESLLEFFRKTGTDRAVVVDEYGGIAGAVRLEDIADELFGRIETPPSLEPIKLLGPFQ